MDLSVEIGALHLANPVIAASGTFGYGIEFAGLTDLNRLGAIVVKGLSLEPMEGAPAPRLTTTPGGMINAVGLQNVGVRRFISEKLPALRSYHTPIIANVFGRSADEYAEVIRYLESADGLAAYELNISCPNVACGGIQFGSNPQMAGQVVAAARRVSRRPLWVKLSPNVADIAAIARAAEEAGGDALTIANTYPAMSIDFRTHRSRIGNPTGGLSGRAIKPITLRLVYEASRAVEIPIVGLGGIDTAEDVLEYFVVGASAVQVGTANFAEPNACLRIVADLEKLCASENIHDIKGLRGIFQAEKH
ncbi:MAG: dihydroorotate dehydrogenase [Acidobacteria bacterium]|nr:MAG: dihydroorotate dehydrogenase [Acidobacteriota bacterium]